MAEQELKQTFKTEGAEEAVGKLNALEAAQREYAEEVERLNALKVSPGATAEQLRAQKSAVDAAAKSYTDLGGSISSTAFEVSALTSVMSQFSPRLGQIGQGLADFARVAGDIGDVKLEELFTAATKSAGQYASTLKLLGAGGAAALGIGLIVKQWQALQEAQQAVLEKQKEIEAQNRRILDQAADFDERFAGAVAAGNVRPDREEKTREKFDELTRQGVPEDLAFDVAAGIKALTKQQEEFFASRTFGAQRDQLAEDLERGTLTTQQIEQIAKQLGLSAQEVEDRTGDARQILKGGDLEIGIGEAVKEAFTGVDTRAVREADAREILGALGVVSKANLRDDDFRNVAVDLNEVNRDNRNRDGAERADPQRTLPSRTEANEKLAGAAVEGVTNFFKGINEAQTQSMQSFQRTAESMERAAKHNAEVAQRAANRRIKATPTNAALAETT